MSRSHVSISASRSGSSSRGFPSGVRAQRVALWVVVVLGLVSVGCTKSAPPDGTVDVAAAVAAGDTPPLPVVTDSSSNLLFSFVDAAGRMISVPEVAAVPEPVRQRVLVVDLDKTPEQRQAHRYAFFADLTTKQADGSYAVVVVSRYDAAKGKGVAAVAALPPPDGSVVVYSAVWCGYCKKAKAWLDDKGIPYLERDVEKTAGAAAELQQKLAQAGVPGGGIPVIDWAGTMIVGFDVAAMERLASTPPPPPAPTPPPAPAGADLAPPASPAHDEPPKAVP